MSCPVGANNAPSGHDISAQGIALGNMGNMGIWAYGHTGNMGDVCDGQVGRVRALVCLAFVCHVSRVAP